MCANFFGCENYEWESVACCDLEEQFDVKKAYVVGYAAEDLVTKLGASKIWRLGKMI